MQYPEQEIAPYTASNCFVTGVHAANMQEMISKIAGVVDQTSLPSGSNAEIVKGTMAEACMTMVTKVGEDIKTELRKIAVEAYNNKLAPRDTAKLIGEKIDSFSRARCQAIARTETCRAANLANHLNATEMGAKSYSVICNEGACEYCIAEYGANQDTVYAIDDTDNLPPYHTNCRCTPIYSMEEPPNANPTEPDEPVELTNEELNNLTFKQLAEYHGAEYKGVEVYDYDNRKYHTFVENYDNGKSITLRFEEGAVKSYAKKGIATPNEIIHEVFNVPKVLKQETNEIWFKNTNHGIQHKLNKSGYDTFDKFVGGYNLANKPFAKKYHGKTDPEHRIIINPKYFKGGGGKYSFIWEQDPNKITNWRHTIHHEFVHSIDMNRQKWKNNDFTRLCYDEEYTQIHKKEPGFTSYASTAREESFAEHGGYVSHMLKHPEEHAQKITLDYFSKGEHVKKDITFDEYKKLYPEHYNFFLKLFEE
jgi:hypothetical protein